VNVIFLDIDGVLNNRRSMWLAYHHKHYPTDSLLGHFTVDKLCVDKLRKVVEDLDLKIVISSTWRSRPGSVEHALAWAGWYNPPVIGVTGKDPSRKRGREIDTWLSENKVDQYAIIDDDVCDIHQKDRLVQCVFGPNRGRVPRDPRTRRGRQYPSKNYLRKFYRSWAGLTDSNVAQLRELFRR